EIELPEQPDLELGRAGPLPDERLAVVEADLHPHVEAPDAAVERHAERAPDLVDEGHTALGGARDAAAPLGHVTGEDRQLDRAVEPPRERPGRHPLAADGEPV